MHIFLITINLFLFTSLSNASVFKNINSKPIVLSDQLLSSIDIELFGKKSKSVDKVISNVKDVKKVNVIESPKNLCYKLRYLTSSKLTSSIQSYSNSKLTIPKLNKNNEIIFSVKNLPNSMQVSFGGDGFISTNSYFGNSSGVEIDCIDYLLPILTDDEGITLRDGTSGILVKVSKIIDEIIIEDEGQVKVYLDKNLKLVDFKNRANAKFIYFKNLSPGNTIVKIGIPEKGFASEIVHLISGENTFIDDRFIEIKNLNIKFYNKNLMGNKDEPFPNMKVLDSGLPGFFKSKISGSQSIVSALKRRHSKLLVYNNQKVQGKTLYYNFGNSDQDIVIPSREYSSLFFDRNNLDDDREFCIVEIKLNKNTSAVYASNSDGIVIDSPDVIVMDKFGKMLTSVNTNSRAVYFIGYLEGVIDYRLAYRDGKSQYGQVPCSDDSYIIEQLR
jgi:hypothetical protein